MVRFILSFLLITASLHLHAQGWLWGRGSTGNNVSSWPVAADNSGNIYVAGVSGGNISFNKFDPSFAATGDLVVLAKYDRRGNFLWSRNTQNNAHAGLVNIATDPSGNCCVLGWMRDSSLGIGSVRIINTVYPAAQYFVAKYNPDGEVLWAVSAGGRSGSCIVPAVAFSTHDTAKLLGLGAITTDAYGNIYITGGFNLPSVSAGGQLLTNSSGAGGTGDIMLAGYDANGNALWATSAGGRGEDIPTGITVTPAGDVYIAGMFNSDSAAFGSNVIYDTAHGAQKWNAFIARYIAEGSPVMAAGSCGGGSTYASGLTSDRNNCVYLVGGTAEGRITFGDTDIINPGSGPVAYLVKFDKSDETRWHRSIGSSTGGASWGYSTCVSKGVVWLCGAMTNQVSIDGSVIGSPERSVDPVFIAGFDTSGYYYCGGALQSGGDKQAGVACDIYGNPYLCANYKFHTAPFIIANNVLKNAPLGEDWLYLARFSCGGSSGPGPGSDPDLDLPQTLYNTHEVVKCSDESIALAAPSGYSAYRWNNDATDSLFPVAEAGTYWVTSLGNENSNDKLVDTFHVTAKSELCDCQPYIPNAFTPNGSGSPANNTFSPLFQEGCFISKYAFSIYNRWGECVFYTEDPYAKWDGRYKGAKAELGVYMVYLRYTPDPKYPQQVRKGDVTLIR